jgi:hypothetical protein
MESCSITPQRRLDKADNTSGLIWVRNATKTGRRKMLILIGKMEARVGIEPALTELQDESIE